MALEKSGVQLVAEGESSFLSAMDRSRDALGKFTKQTETAAGSFSASGQIITGALREIGSIAVNSVVSAGQAVASFAGDSVQVAADYETTLNRFASVTGGALEASGQSVDSFSQLFLDMGAKTQFSAAQAADAAVALAKGGIDPLTIASGGLEGALALAAAGELDLAAAAEITAKQLGVWSDQGVTAAQVADQLAQAANASTVDVDELALGLAQAGGQAKVSGLDFNELTTSLALLAPNFASASDAGTSFKTFLARLIPSTAPASEAMTKLGLITHNTTAYMEQLRQRGIDPTGMSLDDMHNRLFQVMSSMGELGSGTITEQSEQFAKLGQELGLVHSAFFDNNGQLKSMAEVSQILQDATKGLTEEERSLALQTIFGSDALRAAAAIAESGSSGYQAMATAMGNAGTAAEQAAERNKGFNFAMESLKGSVETLQIVLGTTLLPILADLINTYLIPGVNAVMSFAQAILGADAPMQTLVASINGVIPGFSSFVDFVQQAWTAAQPLVDLVSANLVPILGTLAALFVGAVAPAVGAAVVSFLSVAAPIAAMVAAGVLLYTAWQSNFGGIRDIVQTVMQGIQQVITAVLSVVLAFWQQNGQSILATARTAFETVKTIIATAMQIIGEVVSLTLGRIAEFWRSHSEQILAVASAVWAGIKTVIEVGLALIQGVLKVVLAALQGDWQGAWEAIKQTAETIVTSIKTNLGRLFDEAKTKVLEVVGQISTGVTGKMNEILTFIQGLPGRFTSAGAALITALKDGILGQFADLINTAKQKLQELTDLLPGSEPRDPRSPLRGLGARGEALVSNFQAGIEAQLPQLQATVAMALQPTVAPPMSSQQISNRSITYGGNTQYIDATGNSQPVQVETAVRRANAELGYDAWIRMRTGG